MTPPLRTAVPFEAGLRLHDAVLLRKDIGRVILVAFFLHLASKEAIQDIVDARRISVQKRSCQSERVLRDGCNVSKSFALRRIAALELVDLISYEIVDAAFHVLVDVFRNRILARRTDAALPRFLVCDFHQRLQQGGILF